MASPETWAKLRYFKPTGGPDNWGDPDAMDDSLLFILDDFRHYIGEPIYVLHGNDGVHSANSYHYIKNGSKAVDIIIPTYKKSPVDLIFDALRFPFTGLGFYPDWQWNGLKGNGLHLDVRPHLWDPDETVNYSGARWLGVKQSVSENGKTTEKQVYLPLTFENLLKHFGGSNGKTS